MAKTKTKTKTNKRVMQPERKEQSIMSKKELKARIAELEAEINRLSDPLIKDLRFENGQINMAIAGPIVERMALAMAGYFRETGAENYIEMTLNARDDPFERFCVTIQKIGAKTPHQLRLEAETKLAEALARS